MAIPDKIKKKKMLVICPYPEKVAPSQRLKYEQYFNHFREHQIEITVSNFISLTFWKILYQRGHYFSKAIYTLLGYFKRVVDLFRIPFYDIVYIHLWVTPFGPPIFEFLVTFLNKRIVYDIDDMVFLPNVSKSNSIIGRLKGRDKPLYLMKNASHIIVCTPTLENVARKYNGKITDISSTINTAAYKPINTYINSTPLIIGWSGSLSTSKYLKLLENVLEKLKQKYDFDVLVIGDPSFKFDRISCTAIPWKEQTEVEDLQKIDIGLYPLPLDEEWVLGKSGLKALQYMALGLPTVATAIGANYRVIEDGKSGLLVKTEQEWLEALSKLIEDPLLRKQLGEQGRIRVESYYSINANKDVYLSIINEVINA